MAALADLQTAVTNLTTSVNALIAAQKAHDAATVAASDVETQVTALGTLKTAVDAETAAITAPPTVGP